ncbi:MAG TPA: NADH-quinone oxidoreductase subunit J [Gammaproteobacteria bacterium]|nr:NADH-quinone oxidoreductase subunit J [Gammaproteobacteria bacterium]
MTLEAIVFLTLSAILLGSALAVIVLRNPVHAALSLVLSFFATGGLWLLLEAEFLALTLVLVYVGAVMVLFLFVVMMLDINIAELRAGFASHLPLGLLVATGMVLALLSMVGGEAFGPLAFPEPPPAPADAANTRDLGRLLFTRYVYPFQIAAVILLVAIVAAIALTMRPSRQTRAVKPEWQVTIRREDRVRLVKGLTEENR